MCTGEVCCECTGEPEPLELESTNSPTTWAELKGDTERADGPDETSAPAGGVPPGWLVSAIASGVVGGQVSSRLVAEEESDSAGDFDTRLDSHAPGGGTTNERQGEGRRDSGREGGDTLAATRLVRHLVRLEARVSFKQRRREGVPAEQGTATDEVGTR